MLEKLLLLLLTRSVTFAGAASSDLPVSSRPVLCKVMTKTQISLFSSSRDAGVPCTERIKTRRFQALTQLNFQSCLEIKFTLNFMGTGHPNSLYGFAKHSCN